MISVDATDFFPIHLVVSSSLPLPLPLFLSSSLRPRLHLPDHSHLHAEIGTLHIVGGQTAEMSDVVSGAYGDLLTGLNADDFEVDENGDEGSWNDGESVKPEPEGETPRATPS
jgi:hypothetical protein